MITRLIGIVLATLLLGLTACNNGSGLGSANQDSKLHTSFLIDLDNQMQNMLDDEIGMHYMQVDLLMLNEDITKEQYDSIMFFKRYVYEYRNFLYTLHAKLVARVQGIPETEADTTRYLLVSNSGSVVAPDKADIEKLKQFTDSLKVWYCNLPYTDDDSYQGPEEVRDYGKSGESFEWTAVNFENKTVSEQLLTIRSLVLHSCVVESCATNSFIVGARRQIK
jgi:hypothetical protein